MKERYEAKYKEMSGKDKVFDALNRIPELWRNQIKAVIPADMQAKGCRVTRVG